MRTTQHMQYSDGDSLTHNSSLSSSYADKEIPYGIPRKSSIHDTSANIDVTTRVIGDFGKWQLWTCTMMTLLKLPVAWYQLNILFMAPPQEFWCQRPEILRDRYSEEEWRYICAPLIEEHPCLIFKPEMLATSKNINIEQIPLVRCEEFVFSQAIFNRTIISDWDLVCSRHWLVHLTQCFIMWSILTGGIIFGLLADKFGRKKPIVIAIIFQSVFSFIVSFAPSYRWFMIDWFFLGFASGGVGIISFVICMEAVSGKYRTIMPVIYQIPFGLGNAVMALLAYWLRDWRYLEVALASLSSLYILCSFYLTESPRWLLATGRTSEAIGVLKKVANINKMESDFKELRCLLPKHKQKPPGLTIFCRSKTVRRRTCLLSLNWFCTGLSFYTFSQYVGLITANIFLAVGLSGLLSTFGGIACLYIITHYGRKTTVAVFQIVTALCFVFLLIAKNKSESDWPKLLCAGIGFAGMAVSIPALYLFSGELYPTLGRNIGISCVTMFARIASMIAPAVVNLETVVADLPLMILTVMSVAQVFLLLPLPETKDTILPDNFDETYPN